MQLFNVINKTVIIILILILIICGVCFFILYSSIQVVPISYSSSSVLQTSENVLNFPSQDTTNSFFKINKIKENYETIKDLRGNTIELKPMKYDPNNYDVVYHDIEADINKQSGIYKTQKNFYNVIDKDGKMTSIPYYGNENPTLPVYNKPGSFIYGTSNYTPTYKDTIYLNQTTGLSSTRNLTPEYNYIGGFCQQYKHSKIELEKKCNSISRDQCASTSCCVLLGGSKCVSGNNNGPYRKANYTDTTIRNKDYYYYNGKCYGNCDSSIRDDFSDDESTSSRKVKKDSAAVSEGVKWKTYLTPEENNMLETIESSEDDPKSSNLHP